MNAVRLTSAAIELPNAAAVAVSTSFGAVRLSAANDSTPPRQTGSVALPLRIADRGRRDRELHVSISREAVTLSSPDASAATEPLSSYRGISATVSRGEGEPFFRLVLEHIEPKHSVPLASGTDIAQMAREWQAWAKALSLPLLAVDADGEVHAELNALGVVMAETPSPRRRGSALVGRRSSYGRRRREALTKCAAATNPVHNGEREIIART